MMSPAAQKGEKSGQLPEILYSCYTHASREGEQFVGQHVFSYMITGSLEVSISGRSYLFQEGDFRFLRKNQLAKFVKRPGAGGVFKTISVVFDPGTLVAISKEHDWHSVSPYTGENAMVLKSNDLFRNYIDSLSPYMNEARDISLALTQHKVREAVLLLLEFYPELKDALFDFSEPGKMDLEAYMNEHYRFNVDIDRFAYMTGRSLATFKRDFEKVFHTTPNRWLQDKRLKDAYYLIKEKGWKTSDVYLEVGFKDVSHFSFAFKKTFGLPPSKIGG